MNVGIIYCALFPNNKKYYGKTKNSLEDRIKKHLVDSNVDNLLFHKALKKYKNEVQWIIVESYEYKELDSLISKLNEREIYWIETDKTYVLKYGSNYGYNMTPGGDGGNTFSGRHHSEKTRLTMKNSRLAYLENNPHGMTGKIRPEHSQKMKGEKNPMFGHIYTDETREKMRMKKLGKKNPAVSEKKRGVKLSEEHKQHIKDAWQLKRENGYKMSEEHKQHIKDSKSKRKQHSL